MEQPLPALIYRRDGHVAHLLFNRPHALNAIDVELAGLFRDACRDIACDDGVRVVALEGAGRAFVAGGDLRILGEQPACVAPELIDPMAEGVALLAACAAPVLASVHGAVAGAGISLMAACDLVLAAEGTRFNMAYLNIGVSCDVGASWFLPRILGSRRAAELALMNPVWDATQALDAGLVNWVVAADERASRAEAIVASLLRNPPIAAGWMKRLLRQSSQRSLQAQLDAERTAFSACLGSADFTEAMDALANKRTPQYQGR